MVTDIGGDKIQTSEALRHKLNDFNTPHPHTFQFSLIRALVAISYFE